MRRACLYAHILVMLAAFPGWVNAQATFVNGIIIPGDTLDATDQPGANAGRLGMFSDLYYDPVRDDWWALSDRGPGGGLLDYSTRVQRFRIQVHPHTGRIHNFKILDTVKLTDPNGLLLRPSGNVGEPEAMNGFNSQLLNGNPSTLGRSFDPEGLAIDPRTGHLLIADEYGPSLYEFDRNGVLIAAFETPANLVPKVGTTVNYVATRDDGLNRGRQDNRGYEGLAISPDGKRLYAILQDPRTNEDDKANVDDTDTDGRQGQNVRIVVFNNDPASGLLYRMAIAQYVYQLEPQAAVLARIVAAGGTGSATDPRQGRNIGVSAIVALNDTEFLVLERDNRGIGVENPTGVPGALGVSGSKRIFKVTIPSNVTDVTNIPLARLGLTNSTTNVTIVPVTKTPIPFLDLVPDTLLPNGNQAEKWEGVTIGPELKDGSHLILVGNDNDYSVTQIAGGSAQFDIYVDFAGHFAKCELDNPSRCIINPADITVPITDANAVSLPGGLVRLPGILHAYKASLPTYVSPAED
jgi:hypothetical protein